MTQYSPTLTLKRLVVTRRGGSAFDEKFSPGVNVIRGNNSTGKSTVADLIYFALGGEGCQWKEEALLCDSAFAEVSIDGGTITLRRDITDKKFSPMYVFWGGLDEADGKAVTAWEKFPFIRSKHKDSFSQVLFRTMNMPEVRGDGSSNITMHQILRLIYVNQTSGSKIFRQEQFDSALTRETAGNLLYGIYNADLYDDQLKLDKAEKEFDASAKQLRNIYMILGEAQQYSTVQQIRESIKSCQDDRISLYDKLGKLKSKRSEGNVANLPGGLARQLIEDLRTVKNQLSSYELDAENNSLEIADSRSFIDALTNRLASLNDSIVVSHELGGSIFSFCPSCFAPVKESDSRNVCPLCKSEAGGAKLGDGMLRMRNQLEIQIKESTNILEARNKKLNEIENMLPDLYAKKEMISLRYDDVTKNIASSYETEIEEVQREIGALDQRIETLVESERLYALLEDLLDKKSKLSAIISELKDRVSFAKVARDKLKQDAYASISKKTASLLRQDLARQEAFSAADKVDFDFGADRIEVDGEQYFSASSMVYLRNSFHLAMLWSSAMGEYFRYPRFLLMDSLEEGGMEKERSQNFQRHIVELSDSIDVEHQIIFTTSEIDPDLESSGLTVGDFFTVKNKSLKI